jgi:cell division cycle 14
MSAGPPGAVETIEIVKGRFYWTCLRAPPADTADAHHFSTDDVLIYDPYYSDFGPLNIAQVCRYCRIMRQKFEDKGLENKRIYHCCRQQSDTRANAALLCCTWSLLCAGKAPHDAWAPFAALKPSLVPYRDASLGPPSFHLTVLHCLQGLAKAVSLGWFDLDTFDVQEYEHYERVENGDFNWLVPGKFLAFSGPTQTPIAYVDGVKTNTPETYYDYFHKTGITGIVRFNNKVYDRKKFIDAGFNHYDMYFTDGGNPTEAIIKRFLEVCETEKGALAVHCKVGFGRIGIFILFYLMKHFGLTYYEIIGWLRVCRPGSVIGPQQNFLGDMEKRMWREGEAYRRRAGGMGSPPSTPAPAANSAGSVSAQMKGLSVSGSSSTGGRSPVGANTSPNPMRPPGGGVGARTTSPVRAGSSSPLKQKATSLLKR